MIPFIRSQYCAWSILPSRAIDRTEFSTSQFSSRSVSIAFFTDLDTVLSSINFVTSLREFIFALKWGDFNMRSKMSSRKSSTAVTRSGWKRIHSSLIPDKSSGILTSLCLKQNNNKKKGQTGTDVFVILLQTSVTHKESV